MDRPFVVRNQVVFDKQMGEYVNFRKWDGNTPLKNAFVYNPRCGETYITPIRLLTVSELGAYTD